MTSVETAQEMSRSAPFALCAAALAAATSFAPAAPAQADSTTDPVQVVTSRSTYLPGDEELGPPTLHVPQGVGVTVTNLDAFAAHSITSDAVVDPVTGARLFESGILNLRDTAVVQGVAQLAPGTYTFHCSVHEDNMRGTLVVL